MQSKGRFPMLALAGYFKAERLVGEACEDLRGREGANGLFFTHSDHLGSSSWTTDADGRAVQHMEYLPFGEELLNQRATSYSERYTFTGKELDEESNLYYYDARYNSSTYSQFIAVDPMSDKYPSVNPYLYCAGNPIKYVDPDGREFDDESNQIAMKDQSELSGMWWCFLIEKMFSSDKKEIKELENCMNEIQRSIEDIVLMRNDPYHCFTYKGEQGNEGGFDPKLIRKSKVTINYGIDDPYGIRIHENRHWGDILRGELTEDNYSRCHEVSAYRAQYAARGGFLRLWILYDNGIPGIKTFKGNINEITPHIVDNIIFSIDKERVYDFNNMRLDTKSRKP